MYELKLVKDLKFYYLTFVYDSFLVYRSLCQLIRMNMLEKLTQSRSELKSRCIILRSAKIVTNPNNIFHFIINYQPMTIKNLKIQNLIQYSYLNTRMFENAQKDTKQKKNIDIWLTFGDDSDQKKILQCDAVLEVGGQNEELSKYMMKKHHAQEDDFLLMVKFRVAPGREKQATQYLQKGMDQSPQAYQQNQCLNPIQKMIIRPKSTGRVFFEQQEGVVIIYYNLYHETLDDFQVIAQLQELKDNQQKEQAKHAKIYFNLFIRGQEQKNMKQKTTVLANYMEINIQTTDINFEWIINLLNNFQLFPQELLSSPIMKIFTKGLKKIKLKGNLTTMRRIRRMYKQMAKKQQSKSYDPYIHKNLLKNKVQVAAYWKPFGSVKGNITFNHQDHMLRAIRLLDIALDS